MDSKLKSYRKLLADVDSELHEDDIKSLKFLCAENLGTKLSSGKFSNGVEIFDALEKCNLLSKDNLNFLHDMLRVIGRIDLASLVSPVACLFNIQPVYVSPFRQMLFKLSEELSLEDVARLRRLYGKVPKRLNIEDGLDLFTLMLQHKSLSSSRLEELKILLHDIERADLLEIINEFENNSPSVKTELQNPFSLIEVTPVPESCSFTSFSEPELNKLTITVTEPADSWKLNSTSIASTLEQKPVNIFPSSFSMTHPTMQLESENVPVSLQPAQMVSNAENPSEPSAGLPSAESSSNNDSIEEPAYIPIEHYKMEAEPRGICLIIDNQIFQPDKNDPEAVTSLGNRDGSDKDSAALKQTFQKLKFKVDLRFNLTDAEIINSVKAVSMDSHADHDCFICCILSHGGENHVFGTNGRKVLLGEITSMFRVQSCPSLAGKPKLFFMACCRGKSHQHALQELIVDADKPEIYFNTNEWVPNEADFLYGYSTVANYVSYRSKSQGTFYINELTKIFDTYAHREDLQTLLLRVNDAVSKKIYSQDVNGEHRVFKQTPAPQHTLRKQLRFL